MQTIPLELGTALSFGALLVLVMLLGKALQNRFGETGVLALAAASGVADVDAIALRVVLPLLASRIGGLAAVWFRVG